MNVKDSLKREITAVWADERNKRIIKDVLLLSVAAVVFHFLYWNTDMNSWLFGPYTESVYGFFKTLAFKISLLPVKVFVDKPFDINDTAYYFYSLNDGGVKIYELSVEVVEDCSGVKQLLQFLLIMLLCRGKWWKKIIYFIIGSIIILLFNGIRIFLLTLLFASHPNLFTPVHDWVARPMMYVIIFSLWLVWITFFAKNKAATNKDIPKE